MLQARKSLMFGLFAAVLLWGTQLAFAVEAWRAKYGRSVAEWLEVLGEFEALSSLAAYAYDHPAYPFPEVVDAGPLLDATGLGHPLIPAERRVVNDVTLGEETRVLIVSGSNMSGKSTLLRSVGCNTVMALAGGPVCANRMRLSPLAVGASIAIRDSLLDDTSHFYAELIRLRGIVGLSAGALPVLFLVDEILHGTNSRDRHRGTATVIRRLLDDGAIGLATTHDLSLGDLEDELAPAVANVHFQDDLVDGRMVFDYLLRPGIVERSNALELMRSLGLVD
jgi:DNA mismatch repair ATPase MutS